MARSSSSLPLFFFVGILLIALVLRIVQSISPDHKAPSPATPKEQVILNQTTCTDAGGTWNACGSLCRTNPGVPCAEVCVEQCECVSSDQCPLGYTCSGVVDGQGTCEVLSPLSL